MALENIQPSQSKVELEFMIIGNEHCANELMKLAINIIIRSDAIHKSQNFLDTGSNFKGHSKIEFR